MRRPSLARRARALTRADQVLGAYLAACLLLGGASAGGALANGLLQLGAVAVIAWCTLTPGPVLAVRPSRWFWGMLAALGVIAALQLIPLPPALWSALPGRARFISDYAALGLSPPWLPLSLAPDRAIGSLLALLPFLGVLSLTMRTTAEGRVLAVWVTVAIAALSIAVGAVQLFSGGASRFYFYEITNHGDAVGFFANRNHQATLFLMALPYIAALAARDMQAEKRDRARRRPLYLGAFAFLTFGAALNGSSAGLALLAPCVGASVLIYLRGIGRPVAGRWVAVAAAVMGAALVFASVGPYRGRFLDKAISGSNSATRGTSISLTAHAARDFMPLGSGVGTFLYIYTGYENPRTLNHEFVNHAHDDWVEIALETGLMGVALLAALVVWLLARGRALWAGDARAGSLARAALTAMGLLLAHSLVDYPSRTAAISCLAGFAIALIATPKPASRSPASARADGDEPAPAARVFAAD